MTESECEAYTTLYQSGNGSAAGLAYVRPGSSIATVNAANKGIWDSNRGLAQWTVGHESLHVGGLVDQFGSNGQLANAGATPMAYTYGPYGEPQDWKGSRFRYTGQVAWGENELYYYKARVYSPTQGRFLQTDPIGMADDENLYAYVAGDPTNATDPSGTEIVVDDPAQRAQVLKMVNSETRTQYKFDDKGHLRQDAKAGINKEGSKYYSSRINQAINSKSQTISVRIGNSVPVDRQPNPSSGVKFAPYDVQKDLGGGTTSRDGSRITVTGNPNSIQSAPDILMHEIVGHAVPILFGGGTGNAVQDENRVRSEIGEPPRPGEPWHTERPNP